MKIAAGEVEQFRSLVERHLGIVFDNSKLGMLTDLLQRRCEHHRLAPASLLTWFAENTQAEVDAIAREVTVGETYFFRGSSQIHALCRDVLPERLRTGGPVHVLSAGCASGEEPYTLAIAARESGVAPKHVVIRAVDVNRDALLRAQRARYTTWSLRETPPAIQRAWFRTEGREVVLDDAIRGAVQFEQRNLIVDDPELWAPESYDVVFCRNVIMYFARDTMKQVVERITRALRPGGYLFLGHAETLRGLSNELHLCHTHGAFYYQRGDARAHAGVHVHDVAPSAVEAPSTGSASSWVDAIQRASDRIRALSVEEPTAAPLPSPRRWDLGAALDALRDERYADGLAHVEQLPPEAARDPEVLLLRALLFAQAGQFPAAEHTCRTLLELDELGAGAHYVLALAREGAGDHDGAIEHDQMALHLDPTFAMARLHIGLLSRRAGDRSGARRELSQAVLLLEREDDRRIALFGGGFQRGALISLCRTELAAVEGAP